MNIKEQLLSNAMKFMQSDTARKIMSNERFQQVMAMAFRTTFRVRNELDEAKKRVATRMNLATKDEMRDMRRTVERLERKLRKAESSLKNAQERLADAEHELDVEAKAAASQVNVASGDSA